MKFKIVNEGELFCSDFQYKFIDEKQSDFIGAVSRSNEDTKNEINRQKKYRQQQINEIVNERIESFMFAIPH